MHAAVSEPGVSAVAPWWCQLTWGEVEEKTTGTDSATMKTSKFITFHPCVHDVQMLHFANVAF